MFDFFTIWGHGMRLSVVTLFAAAFTTGVAGVSFALVPVNPPPAVRATKLFKPAAFGPSRPALSSNITYYVRTSGSDSKSGLSPADAFRTIRHAFDTIYHSIDVAGRSARIKVGPGTYVGNYYLSNEKALGEVILEGDPQHPSNVVLTASSRNIIETTNGATLTIRGFKLVGAPVIAGLIATDGGILTIDGAVDGNMEFGANAPILAMRGGRVVVQAGYKISGGGSVHFLVDSGGSINFIVGQTINVVGNPSFGYAFAVVGSGGVLRVPAGRFIGAARGARFSVLANGVINTQGGGLNFFPGTSQGFFGQGGIYF